MQAFGANSVKLSLNASVCYNIYDTLHWNMCYSELGSHTLSLNSQEKSEKSLELGICVFWQAVHNKFSGSLFNQHIPYLPDTLTVTTLPLPLSWLPFFPNSSFHGN